MNEGDNDMTRKWSFDNMPEDYDQHLSRSIPLYRESHFFIERLASYYIKDKDINYEIGCANGTIIGNLAKQYLDFSSTKFVGIDLSNSLITEAKSRYYNVPNVNFVNADASTYNFKKYNLAIIHYCLQFMSSQEKANLLMELYKKLAPGGAVIIFEKTLLSDSYSQDIFSGIYNDFKFDNGYSAQEVVEKSISLRSVLNIFQTGENITFFESVGFRSVYVFFKWGPFEGYLCVK